MTEDKKYSSVRIAEIPYKLARKIVEHKESSIKKVLRI